MDFSALPLLDHHCHALARPAAPLDGPAFRRYFSESADPSIAPHMAYSLFYQRGLRDLAELLDCEPTEEAVLARRTALPPEQHAHRLFQAANIPILLVDTGLRADHNYSLEEQRRFLPGTF